MASLLGGERGDSIARIARGALEESMKAAVLQAMEEVEADRARRSRPGRIARAVALLGIGAVVGYALRWRRLPARAGEELAESAPAVAEEVERDAGSDAGDGRSRAWRFAGAGAVVGLSWLLRRWLRSTDRQSEVTEYATGRTGDVSEEAAERLGTDAGPAGGSGEGRSAEGEEGPE